MHYIARAPFKPGRVNYNWAWRNEEGADEGARKALLTL